MQSITYVNTILMLLGIRYISMFDVKCQRYKIIYLIIGLNTLKYVFGNAGTEQMTRQKVIGKLV